LNPNREPFPTESSEHCRALGFLYDRINYERLTGNASRYPFRLQRMTELLRQLGLADYLHAESPAPKRPLVHIAGTKGKGSTSTMVAAALSAAGLRVGLYTSPHLHALEERFRIDGQPCSPADVVSLVERVRPATESVERELGPASFFELTTAVALLHFDTAGCDAIVLEVGLGGRLDSTNVCSPTVTAVTSIGLDHQHVLGHDVRRIAAEKAGILKPGVPVVSGVLDPAAAEVIARRAAETGSALYQVGRDFQFDHEPAPRWGSTVRYRGLTPPLGPSLELSLQMEGEHQAGNAAVAVGILDLLRARGVDVAPQAVRRGLGQLQCAGRIERFVLPGNVVAIVDGAHNQDSIAALCACLRRRRVARPLCVVFGTSIDKSAEPMLQSLSELADRLILTRFFGNPRFRPPEQLVPLVPGAVLQQTTLIEDPIAACSEGLRSVTPGGTLVICGSFFLAAETRVWVADRAVA
jgi:dihydrofolate synthase/folylpolyglutamate synthase